MKKNWLLLLMTPIFTYANHQYNDLDDDHFYNHDLVFVSDTPYFDDYIESELPYFEDYAELFVEALDDDQRNEKRFAFREAIQEEEEVVTAPVADKRGQQKRATAKAQTSANKGRSKDLRQHSDRPRVTHRDKSDSKANVQLQEKGEAASKLRSNEQFVFQEQEFEKPSVDKQDNEAAPAPQKRSEPVKQQKKSAAVKKEAPARKSSVQSVKPVKEQEKQTGKREQVVPQAAAKSVASAQEQKRPRKVNLQRSAQASKERKVQLDQPIAQSNSKEQVKVASQAQAKQAANKTAQAEPTPKQKGRDQDKQEQVQQKKASRPPAATARQQRRKATVQSEQSEEKTRQAQLQARAKSHHVGKRPIEE